jgi:2'-5' RNA ligase
MLEGQSGKSPMSAEILFDSVFFAALPARHEAVRAGGLARALAGEQGFGGYFLPPERLHITLSMADARPGVPLEEVVSLARQAGDRIARPPFRVAFNRLQSWQPNNGPLVLVGDDDKVTGLKWLSKDLARAQGRKSVRTIEPHISLVWSTDFLSERRVEPFSWMVREFVLIRSLHGQGRHEILGRWPLRHDDQGSASAH